MDLSINIHPALVVSFLVIFIVLRVFHLERHANKKK